MPFCMKCGNELDGGEFCIKCGAKVESDSPVVGNTLNFENPAFMENSNKSGCGKKKIFYLQEHCYLQRQLQFFVFCFLEEEVINHW